MNTRHVGLLLCLASGLAWASSPSAATQAPPTAPTPLPATLEAALQNPGPSSDGYWAFTTSTRVLKGSKSLATSVVRVDPGKPQGQRCVVLSATDDEGKTKADEVGKSCSEGDEDMPTYAWVAKLLRDARITLVKESAEGADFRVEPRSGSGIHFEGANVQVTGDDMKDLAGTVHVRKTGAGAPYVDHLVLGMRKPEGNTIARVHRLNLDYRYVADPATGLRIPASFDMDVLVRFMGLLDLDTKVEQRFTDVHRVKPR